MKTIHKYEVPVQDDFTIELPEGAEVLTVQMQGAMPHLWALVETENPKEERRFFVRGTGHDCEGVREEDYIGTFQMLGGGLVFHVFKA